MEHLPTRVYSNEIHVKDFQDALEAQLRLAQDARDELMLQLRPETATWGLARFEREYGIVPDLSQSYERRREALRAKRRSRGTATVAQIQRIAQSFSEQPVKVTEHPERYRFTLRFSALDREKTPALYTVVGQARPAHLEFGVILQIKGSQDATVHVGAYSAAVQRIAVYPYLPPKVEMAVEQALAAYASAAIKITAKGIE